MVFPWSWAFAVLSTDSVCAVEVDDDTTVFLAKNLGGGDRSYFG